MPEERQVTLIYRYDPLRNRVGLVKLNSQFAIVKLEKCICVLKMRAYPRKLRARAASLLIRSE